MQRRDFLCAALAASGASLLALGCERPASRESVLRDLLRDVVLPDAAAVVAESRKLEIELAALGSAPTAEALERTRASFRRAALAWQRMQTFRGGPPAASQDVLRSTFWPIRRTAIAELLASTRAFDEAAIGELGVDLKGVFALEHLLFEGPAAGPSWMQGPQAPRVRSLCSALSRDARTHAEHARQELSHGDFSDAFANAGQESVSLVVNQMLATMEMIAADRLGRALAMHANHRMSAAELHGGPSGLSTDIPEAWLATLERFYLGTRARNTGLSALVQPVSPAIDAHVRSLFSSALSAMAHVPRRLEDAVANQASLVQKAIAAVKDVEIATRVDVVGALGVTLSFISTDGD